MIWDILMWLALALLVAVVVIRLVASRSGAGKMGSKGPSRSDNPLTQGLALPTAVVVVLLIAIATKFGPGLINPLPDWSEEEQIEVEQFGEALTLYAQATAARSQTRLSNEDWESIRAVMEAAESEMSSVSNQVLKRIHPDLPAHVAKEFIPGLRMGTYGLMYYVMRSTKSKDPTVNRMLADSRDSLSQGRDLLDKWNTWFKTHGEEIIERIE